MMDATDLTGILGHGPPPAGEAIRAIVQVFHDGCQAAEALRHTSAELSATEIETRLNAIELRMLREISSICGDYLMDVPLLPRH